MKTDNISQYLVSNSKALKCSGGAGDVILIFTVKGTG